MARRATLAVGVVVIAMTAACTHDFGAFEGGSHVDAGKDAAGDAAGDTGSDIDTTPCTPQPSCLTDAQTCAAPCDTTETSCVAACGTPSCRNKCHDAANGCRATCAATCTTCTTNAGCAAPGDCAAAAK
jgi:hypothetical protein